LTKIWLQKPSLVVKQTVDLPKGVVEKNLQEDLVTK